MNASTVRLWLLCTTNGVHYTEEKCFVAASLLYCVIVVFVSVAVSIEVNKEVLHSGIQSIFKKQLLAL